MLLSQNRIIRNCSWIAEPVWRSCSVSSAPGAAVMNGGSTAALSALCLCQGSVRAACGCTGGLKDGGYHGYTQATGLMGIWFTKLWFLSACRRICSDNKLVLLLFLFPLPLVTGAVQPLDSVCDAEGKFWPCCSVPAAHGWGSHTPGTLHLSAISNEWYN